MPITKLATQLLNKAQAPEPPEGIANAMSFVSHRVAFPDRDGVPDVHVDPTYRKKIDLQGNIIKDPREVVGKYYKRRGLGMAHMSKNASLEKDAIELGWLGNLGKRVVGWGKGLFGSGGKSLENESAAAMNAPRAASGTDQGIFQRGWQWMRNKVGWGNKPQPAPTAPKPATPAPNQATAQGAVAQTGQAAGQVADQTTKAAKPGMWGTRLAWGTGGIGLGMALSNVGSSVNPQQSPQMQPQQQFMQPG